MHDSEAVDRFEQFVSYGHPACDRCRDLDPSDRPAQAEYFPDYPVQYLREHKGRACDFLALTVCAYHDRQRRVPDDVTHRVVDAPEYIGDEHQMNSAYEHQAIHVTSEGI
jgi:hypothetical protein